MEEKNKLSVKILGAGCARCKKLEVDLKNVLEELNLKANVEKVTSFEEIATYKVVNVPALVVNNKVLLSGSVLDKERIRMLLKKELKK